MRALPITVTALAAALLLTACDGGGGTSDEKTAGGGAAAGNACAIGKVGLEVGPVNAAPAAGDTGNVSVTVTNTGSECTLNGFPAVALGAGSASADVPKDAAAQAQKLTLAKDATASFTLTYVRGEAGGAKSFAADSMKFSLPGADTTHSFDWTYGDVALKDGTDKPDVSVSAFQQAGD
ncbi:DUF4232 domain-containing protein [Streptomyces sp. NPDC002265]|uniref:DUF4232 domain-containing protein n=1 Tax=Streptomyces sp. NPDC002265 TaxID=3154415 RepID=UPI003319BE8D